MMDASANNGKESDRMHSAMLAATSIHIHIYMQVLIRWQSLAPAIYSCLPTTCMNTLLPSNFEKAQSQHRLQLIDKLYLWQL